MSYQAIWISEDRFRVGDEEYGHYLATIQFLQNEGDNQLSQGQKQKLAQEFADALIKARAEVALKIPGET